MTSAEHKAFGLLPDKEASEVLSEVIKKDNTYYVWFNKVKDCLNPAIPPTLSLAELKELLLEAKAKNFPQRDLSNAIHTAEKYSNIISQLISPIDEICLCNYANGNIVTSFAEINFYVDEIKSLSCVLDESKKLLKISRKLKMFEYNCQRLLACPLQTCNMINLKKCVEHGSRVCIELPFFSALQSRFDQVKWLREVKFVRETKKNSITLEEVYRLVKDSRTLEPHYTVEEELHNLRTMLHQGEKWNARATSLLRNPPKENLLKEIEYLLLEANELKVYLSHVDVLKEIQPKIKQWLKGLEELEFYPYLDRVEEVYIRGQAIPIFLPHLADLKERIIAAYDWIDAACQMFLKKTATFSLIDAICPQFSFVTTHEMELNDFASKFNAAKEIELELVRSLRLINSAKRFVPGSETKFCHCQRGAFGLMLKCEMCWDWFHASCAALSKTGKINLRRSFSGLAFMMFYKDCPFLCSSCERTKHPRLETVLGLLTSLKKLSVRIPEGEALQCLTERAMTWQDQAEQVLNEPEFQNVIAKLSSIAEERSEVVAIRRTVKIISNRLLLYIQESETSVLTFDISSPNGENVQLTKAAKKKLDDILIEGYAMELSLEGILPLWKLLQASRDPVSEPTLLDFDENTP